MRPSVSTSGISIELELVLDEEAPDADLPQRDAVVELGQQLGLDRGQPKSSRVRATLSGTWR